VKTDAPSTLCLEKRPHFFNNNSVKNQPILRMFGTSGTLTKCDITVYELSTTP